MAGMILDLVIVALFSGYVVLMYKQNRCNDVAIGKVVLFPVIILVFDILMYIVSNFIELSGVLLAFVMTEWLIVRLLFLVAIVYTYKLVTQINQGIFSLILKSGIVVNILMIGVLIAGCLFIFIIYSTDLSMLQALSDSLNSGNMSIITVISMQNGSKIFSWLLSVLSMLHSIVYMVRYYVLLKKVKISIE